MAVDPDLARDDLAGGLGRAAAFWGPGIGLVAVTAPIGGWPRAAGWTAGLLWLSGMCLWNYARCRRLHCAFTGPFFLAMAVVTLLAGAGVIPLGPGGWRLLGDLIAVGGVVLCCGPELIWGRYQSPKATSSIRRSR